MNIAAITITYNDGYKFKEWVEHYQEYKSELYLHIIVDNGSEEDYIAQLKSTFTDSIIIERGKNGGCTYAYNDGIRYALSDKKVDAIMLIGNDIKLSEGGVGKLCDFLYSDDTFGMVEPVLLKKDSDIIEDFGCSITSKLSMKPLNYGEHLSLVTDDIHIVEAVTGGMNLAKREFYEQVGLQDDNLFMYSDEVDMAIRARHKNFKLAATRYAVAWHQHINYGIGSQRLPYTSYLMGRNKIYLAYKHFGIRKKIVLMIYHLFLFVKGSIKNILFFNKSALMHQFYFIRGSWNGFIGNMNLKCIIKDFKEIV